MRTMIFHAVASAAFAGALAIALSVAGAQAAVPLSYSRACVKIAATGAPVVKAVTRAGVAHRSARRTSRRVYRRHAY